MRWKLFYMLQWSHGILAMDRRQFHDFFIQAKRCFNGAMAF